MLEKNPKTVKLVYKNYPLPMHKYAFPAALAAMAANEQGKFWDFHDRLFAAGQDLSPDKIEGIARATGLDMRKFEQDLASPIVRQKVIGDYELGREIGVNGTPTIFINGHRLKQRTPEAIQQLIQKELTKGK